MSHRERKKVRHAKPLGTSTTAAYFWMVAAVVSCMFCALWLDVPLARFCCSQKLNGDFRAILDFPEAIARGWGLLYVVAIVFCFDNARRTRWRIILFSAFVPGFIACVIKLAIPRLRPNDSTSIESFRGSFVDWQSTYLPFSWSELLDRTHHSFPSGHTATAFGLAICMSTLYPSGARLFMTIAVLAATQRVVSGAHFLSDVSAGAVLGILIGRLCLSVALCKYVMPPVRFTSRSTH